MRGKKMIYAMPKIGRTVELDDSIVSEYIKTVQPSIVTESPFILALKQDYGHYPSEDEMSFGELSAYRNNVLLQELQFSAALPSLSNFLTAGGEDVLKNSSCEQNK